jgi:hypothetical protein
MADAGDARSGITLRQQPVIALSQWGTEYLFDPAEPRSRPVDARDGQPLNRLRVLSSDGRELGPGDIASAVI